MGWEIGKLGKNQIDVVVWALGGENKSMGYFMSLCENEG